MSSRIAVIGTGYVGLTTGACLSSLGHQVVCADVVKEKVDQLSRGQVPILEAGLDELVQEGLRSEQLRAYRVHGNPIVALVDGRQQTADVVAPLLAEKM